MEEEKNILFFCRYMNCINPTLAWTNCNPNKKKKIYKSMHVVEDIIRLPVWTSARSDAAKYGWYLKEKNIQKIFSTSIDKELLQHSQWKVIIFIAAPVRNHIENTTTRARVRLVDIFVCLWRYRLFFKLEITLSNSDNVITSRTHTWTIHVHINITREDNCFVYILERNVSTYFYWHR